MKLHTRDPPYPFVIEFVSSQKPNGGKAMKNFTSSDYALNKYSEGIVYKFADGIVEIDLEDYLKESPDHTEVGFQAIKQLSDEIYLEEANRNYRQTYKNIPILPDDSDVEAECPTVKAADSFIDEQVEAANYNKRVVLAHKALHMLTETQRRRYLLYHVEKLTMRQIAIMERVNHSKIQKSLNSAEEKIQKFLVSC